MALAIFDLDNTLIAGDSDHAWGQFLVDEGYVDADYYQSQNDKFYADYVAGTLDIQEYVQFSLGVLTRYPKAQLLEMRQTFIDQKIKPIMLSKAASLLQSHRDQGDTLLIITATNRFVTEPIAALCEVEHLIAIEVEENDQGYTGATLGTPSFQEGKITRLEEWLTDHPHSLDSSTFYSDSFNDLPLLRKVSKPVAVDPDDTLKTEADKLGWPIISLR